MHQSSRVVYPEMPLEQLEYFDPVEAYRRRLQFNEFDSIRKGNMYNNVNTNGNNKITNNHIASNVNHLNRSPVDNKRNFGNGNGNGNGNCPISTELPHLGNHFSGISPVSIHSDVLPSSMTSLHKSESVNGVRRASHDLISNDISPPPLNPSAITSHAFRDNFNHVNHDTQFLHKEPQESKENCEEELEKEQCKLSIANTPVLVYDGLRNTEKQNAVPDIRHVVRDNNNDSNKSPNKAVNVYTVERYPKVCANENVMHHVDNSKNINNNNNNNINNNNYDNRKLCQDEKVIDGNWNVLEHQYVSNEVARPITRSDQHSIHELAPSAMMHISHMTTPSHHSDTPSRSHSLIDVESVRSKSTSHKSFTNKHSCALLNEYSGPNGAPINVIDRLQKSGEVMRRERESHQRLREIQRKQVEEADKALRKKAKDSIDNCEKNSDNINNINGNVQSEKDGTGVFDRLYAHAQQHNRDREEREKRAEERRQRERALLPHEIKNVNDDLLNISRVVKLAASKDNDEEQCNEVAADAKDALLNKTAISNDEIKHSVDASFFERLAKPVRVTKKYTEAQEDVKNEREYALKLERERQSAELERFASFKWQLPAKSYTMADLDCQNALLLKQC